jgi:ubiquinol-cytochrome c reductase core subunit 2
MAVSTLLLPAPDRAYFTEILGDVLTQSKFAAHEYHEEVVPAVAVEYEQAAQTAQVTALEMAHQLAFRRGLGNSLFASPYTEVDLLSAVSYARSSFSNPSGIAVLASGIDNGTLSELVGEFYTGSSAASSTTSKAANTQSSAESKYYGGEIRVPITTHGAAEKGSLLVGFQGGNQGQVEFAVLKALLGGESALKWANGTTPLSKLTPLVGDIYKPTVKAFNLNYSDAGLFGIYIEAPTGKVQELASKSVQALKSVAESKVSEEDLKRAIARAKFEAATMLENRVARQEIVGAQILETNSITSLSDAWKLLEGVTAEKVQQAAKSALKSKPTVVAVGDTHKLPWADELGL